MRNKGVAIVLCLFLGGIGAHKFYLGQTGAGIFYLLFCWTFIPGIIAFFELLILLFMSDTDFNAKFNHTMMGNYASGSVSASDTTKALSNLKNLFEQGVITAEEYEQKRRKMLDSL
ncbi:MAG: NINE protein [Crinalium sp.]